MRHAVQYYVRLRHLSNLLHRSHDSKKPLTDLYNLDLSAGAAVRRKPVGYKTTDMPNIYYRR